MGQKHLTSPVQSSSLPSGIPYIIGNEAAERFSFYGMKGILVIYMTKYLMSLDGGQDVMSDDEAKQYYHAFTASAYFFPILGSILADWLLGKYRTIINLSLVYCLGHVALAVADTSLSQWFGIEPRMWLAIGLGLIAIGSGGIKPCVSAHVGDQFGAKNQHLLSKVFAWFYFSINLGAFASTILTPILLDRFGPSVAFGLPGVLMFLATFVFWLGRNKFVHIPPGGKEFFKETFSWEGVRAMLNLSVLYVFIAVFWALFDQTGSAWVLQARYMDRHLLGIEWLPSQIQAANPILVLMLIPIFAYIVYPAINRVFELTPLRKVAIGFFVTILAFSVPSWVEMQIDGGAIFKMSSDHTSGKWSGNNLIDGNADGSGWVSEHEPKRPQEIVIRLRERRAWNISSVRINPATDFEGTAISYVFGQEVPSDVAKKESCWGKDVEVLVGNTPDGPWASASQFSLQRENAFQQFEFASVSAEYVMIRVNSNWGGDYISLGEVEVIAADAMPPGAGSRAAGVWPNLAATGFRPSIVWHLLAYVLLTAAEVMVSITALEFSYTQAPTKMKSFIMGLYLCSVALGNAFTSLVNYVIRNDDGTSKLEGASYYWFFTALMLATAMAFLLVVKFYRGETYIQGEK